MREYCYSHPAYSCSIAPTYSEDPYADATRLTKHSIGQIAKISGELPAGFAGDDFCCRVRENAWQSRRVQGDIAGPLYVRKGRPSEPPLPYWSGVVPRIIVPMHYVGMLIQLPCQRVTFYCHFRKMMLYTKSIRVAYSYLLYTLDGIYRYIYTQRSIQFCQDTASQCCWKLLSYTLLPEYIQLYQ